MNDQLIAFDTAVQHLPLTLRGAFAALRTDQKKAVEELRLRRGQSPAVCIAGGEVTLDAPPVTAQDLENLLRRAAHDSLHAYADELREGYLSLDHGHRLGICGTAVVKENCFTGLRDITSVCLRIARAWPGCAQPVMERILPEGAAFASTLLVSPPGVGKTTCLRDMIRLLSLRGVRVGVVDERREIAGEGWDLGPCTDVIAGAPKADAAAMLVRTMAPQVLAVDEITRRGDVEAMEQAVNCGVQLLATVHGQTLEDVLERPALRELLQRGRFAWCVFLKRGGASGRSIAVRRLEP